MTFAPNLAAMIHSSPRSCRSRAPADSHPLPVVTRGSPDAQLEGRLCGGELCEASVGWRPAADLRRAGLRGRNGAVAARRRRRVNSRYLPPSSQSARRPAHVQAGALRGTASPQTTYAGVQVFAVTSAGEITAALETIAASRCDMRGRCGWACGFSPVNLALEGRRRCGVHAPSTPAGPARSSTRRHRGPH